MTSSTVELAKLLFKFHLRFLNFLKKSIIVVILNAEVINFDQGRFGQGLVGMENNVFGLGILPQDEGPLVLGLAP